MPCLEVVAQCEVCPTAVAQHAYASQWIVPANS